MNAPAPRHTSLLAGADPQHIEDALARLAPRWTTWIVQTLAHHDQPLHVRDIARRLPFTTEQFLGKRLARMHTDGLVTRPDRFGAPYQLTPTGAALAPVHQALADWSTTHLDLGTMAGAERVEDAIHRLHLRHTTAVLHALSSQGPMRFVHLADALGLDTGHTRQRLLRLQDDGLVTRTGTRFGDPYTLTDAAAALTPVYTTLTHWTNSPDAPSHGTAVPTFSTTRLRHEASAPPSTVQTAAALRRTTAAPSVLFSHAPQPQPRVPAHITAQSAPARAM